MAAPTGIGQDSLPGAMRIPTQPPITNPKNIFAISVATELC